MFFNGQSASVTIDILRIIKINPQNLSITQSQHQNIVGYLCGDKVEAELELQLHALDVEDGQVFIVQSEVLKSVAGYIAVCGRECHPGVLLSCYHIINYVYRVLQLAQRCADCVGSELDVQPCRW